MSLGDLLGVLRDAYCRTIGVEYMHIQDPTEKRWMQERLEGIATRSSPDEQRHILERLNAAEALETFLGTKYVGQKRFGIEGAESTIPLLDALLTAAADDGMAEAVIGMAHRGRLNVLVNICGKTYGRLFSEFEGQGVGNMTRAPVTSSTTSGQSGTFTQPQRRRVAGRLAANPSHLEAVDPVVLGMARAQMDLDPARGGFDEYPVLPLLLHGDAAFAGQGVVAETLNLAQIRGYRVGGSVHLIINNQVGFTTAPSTPLVAQYSTDVAKMIQAPIFHVNGDDPEACVRVARLAFEYRQAFNKDVVIDMICYRRHGHNEGDDPSYTLPDDVHGASTRARSVRKLYVNSLVKRGDLTPRRGRGGARPTSSADSRSRSTRPVETARQRRPSTSARCRIGRAARTSTGGRPNHDRHDLRSAYVEARRLHDAPEVGSAVRPSETRCSRAARSTGRWARRWPRHPAARRHIGSTRRAGLTTRHVQSPPLSARRLRDRQRAHPADDTRRRRHSASGSIDSLLSEYAALGFEYGYCASPTPTRWCFGRPSSATSPTVPRSSSISSSWPRRTNGTRTADSCCCSPTATRDRGPSTRRPGSNGSSRWPPKTTCRSATPRRRASSSTCSAASRCNRHRPRWWCSHQSRCCDRSTRDLRSANSYQAPSRSCSAMSAHHRQTRSNASFSAPARLRSISMAERDKRGAKVAIARVEQLYPWPFEAVKHQLDTFPNAREIRWVQEEPENMGPWNAIKGRLYEAHGGTHDIHRVSRFESGSPACGSATVHGQELEVLLEEALS